MNQNQLGEEAGYKCKVTCIFREMTHLTQGRTEELKWGYWFWFRGAIEEVGFLLGLRKNRKKRKEKFLRSEEKSRKAGRCLTFLSHLTECPTKTNEGGKKERKESKQSLF